MTRAGAGQDIKLGVVGPGWISRRGRPVVSRPAHRCEPRLQALIEPHLGEGPRHQRSSPELTGLLEVGHDGGQGNARLVAAAVLVAPLVAQSGPLKIGLGQARRQRQGLIEQVEALVELVLVGRAGLALDLRHVSLSQVLSGPDRERVWRHRGAQLADLVQVHELAGGGDLEVHRLAIVRTDDARAAGVIEGHPRVLGHDPGGLAQRSGRVLQLGVARLQGRQALERGDGLLTPTGLAGGPGEGRQHFRVVRDELGIGLRFLLQVLLVDRRGLGELLLLVETLGQRTEQLVVLHLLEVRLGFGVATLLIELQTLRPMVDTAAGQEQQNAREEGSSHPGCFPEGAPGAFRVDAHAAPG